MVKTPSVEPVLQSRLLPKISTRWLFVTTAMAAVIGAVARAAGEGATFAYAVLAGVGFLVAAFLAFAFVFLIARAASVIWYRPEPEQHEGSPFSDGQLPPQILPPQEPGV